MDHGGSFRCQGYKFILSFYLVVRHLFRVFKRTDSHAIRAKISNSIYIVFPELSEINFMQGRERSSRILTLSVLKSSLVFPSMSRDLFLVLNPKIFSLSVPWSSIDIRTFPRIVRDKFRVFKKKDPRGSYPRCQCYEGSFPRVHKLALWTTKC
jgi:hypothetical protein